MKFTKILLLSLECLISACVVRCSEIKLVKNGYDNVVIAINPGIPENLTLITKIQEMVTSASSFLYNATKHRAYFRDVKILLPITWTPQPSYQRPTTQSYEKANVIIAESHVKFGDDPYTHQYGRCGEKGRYIHFTPGFMLNDHMIPIYGPRGRVLVHEWAHLQWGVFDEYNDLVPFYFSGEEIRATGCSKEIKGEITSCSVSSCSCNIDRSTGLPNGDCLFFPDKTQTTAASIMYLQGLEDVVEFCDSKNHNAEAPNMQNKMCNYRSTWDVISQSEDFKNNPPADITSLVPTFTLLHAKDRVLCLVLDDSGSMRSANRINRLRQAASIFLLQIVELGSQVGIVTFDSTAIIRANLRPIENDNVRKELLQFLPTTADGGTNICSGVRAGFQVLSRDDGATNGDEIVVLTDGEDFSISRCFEEVRQSGAIIHTIALGPSAAKELEQLSSMTGGLQFLATDNVDENGLIDAFTGLVSGNGNISQQSIQLESSGKSINRNSWFNGTVYIDKTIGNDTFFVITWQTAVPSIFVEDPSGKIYNNANFEIDNTLLTGRLAIPGTAQIGAWNYAIQNKATTVQDIAITVTSRAADEKVPPVTVNGHINQAKSEWPKPLIIFAEVSHGFLPVIDANVTATVERADGNSVDVVLLDNGADPDAVKNDGIYSRYFTKFAGSGRYSLKISVQGKNGKTKLAARWQGRAMYIPGYVQNGFIQQNPPRPPSVDDGTQPDLGSFKRVKSGGTCFVSQVPTGTPPDRFPPNKIMDLIATVVEDKIQLNWTAPGDDFDQGNASYYEIRMSKNFTQLKDYFQSAHQVNTTGLNPKTANSEESVMISENIELKNGTVIYFGVVAYDKVNQTSELSNIALAALLLPPPIPSTPSTSPNQSQPLTTSRSSSATTSRSSSATTSMRPPSSPSQPNESPVINITAIVLLVGCVVVIVTLIIAITVCIVATRRRQQVSPR
ncbi:calcium-activated chloride channel regulator 1-like [Pristis pectinata]|uniref:calcium-activated chloride channel regulator 1-like n=1 Tax=Pristis pectinata TaxID=685728 RepID=UPI00223D76CC|nr:calcium-activated chloride channel regulator 1-like [Pristis pectinata]